MPTTFVDLENELAELTNEVETLRLAIEGHHASKPMLPSHMVWRYVSDWASGIEKVFTGCEKIMALIATHIDNSPITHEESWHATLLRRMHNSFPGVRDALLTDESYKALNALRAFRHRERNSYDIGLDAGIVEERATEAITAFQLFREDFAQLKTALD